MNELLVETYEDTQEFPIGNDEIENYNKTVVDLGLEHLAFKNNALNIAPMSDLEVKVYKILCPNQIDIKKYKHFIPKRIIDAYAKCKDFIEENHKKHKIEVQIWEDKDPDPLFVVKADWSTYYLIGRWGKELQDFPTLLKRCKEVVLAKSRSGISEAKSAIEFAEKDPDAFAMALILGNQRNIYF